MLYFVSNHRPSSLAERGWLLKNVIMAGFKFFRVPKHQQFEYKPRYWDPRKEELQKRLADIEALRQEGLEGTKARISSGLRRSSYLADSSYRRRQVLRSNLLLVGIIVALLIIAYLLLTVYLPEFGGGN